MGSRLTFDQVKSLAELKTVVDRLVAYTADRKFDVPCDCEIELHLTDEGMSLRVYGVGAS